MMEDQELTSVFLKKSKFNKTDAGGLLNSVKIFFQKLGIENVAKEKLTGITTNGKNTNTVQKKWNIGSHEAILGKRHTVLDVSIINLYF